MTFPIRITFKGFSSSPTVEDHVHQRARRLEHHHGRITECRVVLQAPHRHHRQGRLYDVRIDLAVPGGELFVHQGTQANHAHEDIAVTVRDAFNAMERKLTHFMRKRGGHAA